MFGSNVHAIEMRAMVRLVMAGCVHCATNDTIQVQSSNATKEEEIKKKLTFPSYQSQY